MDKYKLSADKRTILGRKVKKLRNQGILPGNIYGKKIKSQAVSVPEKEFVNVFSQTGETGLVELVLDSKKMPVLIHNVSYHPLTGKPLHADFYQVDLKEKVTANVPLEVTGESPAVKDKTGVLLTNLDEIEVEALPQDLPEKIMVDVSNLAVVDDAIKVSDLSISSKVKVLSDAELEVVKIAPLVSKEAEKMTEEIEAAKEAAAEAAAGEAPPEAAAGEAPAEAAEAPASKEPPQTAKEEKPKPSDQPSKEEKS